MRESREPGGVAERPAEAGDVDVDRMTRRLGWMIRPELVDEPLHRHRLTGPHGELSKEGTLLGRSQVDRLAFELGFQRAKEPQGECLGGPAGRPLSLALIVH